MTKKIHFETSLQELEAIVALLEKGELPLDDALLRFEQGVLLARQCQTVLQEAEQKIEQLTDHSANEDDDEQH